jgi:hypothetical protein
MPLDVDHRGRVPTADTDHPVRRLSDRTDADHGP